MHTQYVTNKEDFNTSREIALVLTDWLYKQTNGHFLISLQALDLVQDAIQHQALTMKLELDREKENEVN